MTSHTTLILLHDIKSSIRGTAHRLGNHIFTTFFSLLLILPFMAAITGVVIYIFTYDNVLRDMISAGDIFFTIFILTMGRALNNTIRHVYKDPSSDILRIVAIPDRELFRGKLCSVVVINLITFTFFYLGFLFFFVLIYPDPIESRAFTIYTAYFYFIALFATLTGFILPMVYYLRTDLRKKVLGFLSPTIVGGALLISISDLEVSSGAFSGDIVFPSFLGCLTLILIIATRNLDSYFNEAMHNRIPKLSEDNAHLPRLVGFIHAFSFLGDGRSRRIDHGIRSDTGIRDDEEHDFASERSGRNRIRNIIAAKELLGNLRDSYFHIYAGMTLIMTIMGVFVILTLPPEFTDGPWGWIVYPTVISFMLYIEGSFMVTLGSISVIGKEGKRLWILKSLPVSGHDVLSGKAISVIIPSIIGGFIMVIPLLAITRLPAGLCCIFLVLTLGIILAFSGIGIMAGVKYPNFTEGSRGSPDIVFQLFILFICLILLGFIVVPPMTFYYNWGWQAGLFASLFVLIFCYAVFVGGVRMGERIFKRLSCEVYD